MAAELWQSKQVKANDPAITPRGASETVWVRNEFDIATTAGGMGAAEVGDVVEMVILPAGCVPVEFILDTDDLDAATAMTISAGVMAGALTDRVLANRQPGAEIFATVTTAQAGGVARPTLATAYRIAVDKDADRAIGIEFIAIGTPATTGKIGLTVGYRSAVHGA